MINAPTVSPDHQWIVYQRSSTYGSLGNAADLYVASVANPGSEVRLDALDGDDYPFAAGARDLHLNFEPTFAPVAAGRLLLGRLPRAPHLRQRAHRPGLREGGARRQAALGRRDRSEPGARQGPEPPGLLPPGPGAPTLNMRGFWALDPCKGDGKGCQSGTECCGGYCTSSGAADAGAGDSGGPVCTAQSSGCSKTATTARRRATAAAPPRASPASTASARSRRRTSRAAPHPSLPPAGARGSGGRSQSLREGTRLRNLPFSCSRGGKGPGIGGRLPGWAEISARARERGSVRPR